jgi:protein-L-isoaspartate(D-aspartate) O-methyltransferase
MMRDALTRAGWGLVAIVALAACRGFVGPAHAQDATPGGQAKTAETSDPTAAARNRMVQRHLVERGIKNPRVLEAFRTVPRHRFLPPRTRRQAYDDESIPIGEGQTITPPYDVAFMTEVLDPKPTDKVYEVGTGSGYQSAILSRLVKEVYSIEIHAPLGERAAKVHKELGYDNIHTRIGDGYEGWPEAAPFDAIIVTCAPHRIPRPLIDQLKEGGRMVIPLGDRFTQIVHLVIKKDGKLIDKELKPTLFVPMTGKAQKEGPEPKPAAGAPAQDPAKGDRGRGRTSKSRSKSSAGASAKESSGGEG